MSNNRQSPNVPVFAEIAQPNWKWREETTTSCNGETQLPDNDGNPEVVAIIAVPDGDFLETPEGRVVRVHEMLHARFTPEIEDIARERKGHTETVGTSPLAKQVAEDVRLHKIGTDIGVLGGDVHITPATYEIAGQKEESHPIVKEFKMATMYMSMYGLPVEENAWSSKDLSAFQAATSHSFSRRSRRLLRAWSRLAENALALPTGSEQFVALSQKSQKVLTKILTAPEPPKGAGQKDDNKENQQGKSQAGGKGGDSSDASQDASDANQQPESGNNKTGSQNGAGQSQKIGSQKKTEQNDGGAHPETGNQVEKKFKEASEKVRSLETKVRNQGHASPHDNKEYARLTQKKAAIGNTMHAIKSATGAAKPHGGKLGRWVPQFLDSDVQKQLRIDAQTEQAARWKPPVVPITSRYERWDGPPPDEATAQDYSLDAGPGWHTMKTALGPLQRNFKAQVKRTGVAAPEGPIPKFFSRWFSDKQLFERKGRRLGGTLLIDISGSMGWSHYQTLALIESTPAMTIAIYSSDNESSAKFREWASRQPSGCTNAQKLAFLKREGHGRLTIIAQHGKLVPADYDLRGERPDEKHAGHGGGNEVDGPALAWLCRQARPRVWYSDGQVTGTGEVGDQYIWADSRRLQRLGGIIRTTNAAAVPLIFAGTNPAQWQTMERVWMPGANER